MLPACPCPLSEGPHIVEGHRRHEDTGIKSAASEIYWGGMWCTDYDRDTKFLRTHHHDTVPNMSCSHRNLICWQKDASTCTVDVLLVCKRHAHGMAHNNKQTYAIVVRKALGPAG